MDQVRFITVSTILSIFLLVNILFYVRLSAPGRIVALVEAARAELDKLLLRKISQPDTDLLSSDLLKIISVLFETDGLG